MGHKKRKERFNIRKNYSAKSQQVHSDKRKKGISKGTKMLLGIVAIVFIGGIAYWQLSPQQTYSVKSLYPQTVAGTFFSNPSITSVGTEVGLPYGFVDENKLVFIDMKLENRVSEITYQGRTIPLNLYRSGEYLPLTIISTPSKKVISGIRVCEPCGSFSFHIVQAKYLQCDTCGTRWDIESFSGVSGGCTSYPPPKLTSTVGSNIEIDLSSLGIKVIQ